MLGIFDGIEKSVGNALDVVVGVATLGEYGDFSKRTVSKMIADGIEVAVIAQAFDVGIDIVESMIEKDEE